jgi:hypothetical protein
MLAKSIKEEPFEFLAEQVDRSEFVAQFEFRLIDHHAVFSNNPLTLYARQGLCFLLWGSLCHRDKAYFINRLVVRILTPLVIGSDTKNKERR